MHWLTKEIKRRLIGRISVDWGVSDRLFEIWTVREQHKSVQPQEVLLRYKKCCFYSSEQTCCWWEQSTNFDKTWQFDRPAIHPETCPVFLILHSERWKPGKRLSAAKWLHFRGFTRLHISARTQTRSNTHSDADQRWSLISAYRPRIGSEEKETKLSFDNPNQAE